MPVLTATTIAPHVEAAKRLLREIEQHTDAALDTLSQGGGTRFLAAVEERETLLSQLAHVVGEIARERAQSDAWANDEGSELAALVGEVTRAATAVLDSHERLVARATEERDRLSAAINRSAQPDSIANQYAATTHALPRRTLSVTG